MPQSYLPYAYMTTLIHSMLSRKGNDSAPYAICCCVFPYRDPEWKRDQQKWHNFFALKEQNHEHKRKSIDFDGKLRLKSTQNSKYFFITAMLCPLYVGPPDIINKISADNQRTNYRAKCIPNVNISRSLSLVRLYGACKIVGKWVCKKHLPANFTHKRICIPKIKNIVSHNCLIFICTPSTLVGGWCIFAFDDDDAGRCCH